MEAVMELIFLANTLSDLYVCLNYCRAVESKGRGSRFERRGSKVYGARNIPESRTKQKNAADRWTLHG